MRYNLNFICVFNMIIIILDILLSAEHLTYLGNDEKLGPIAISLKREKLDENTSLVKNDTDVQGTQYQYRIIVRTSHVSTLIIEVSWE